MERENAIPEKSIHTFVKQAELWRLHSWKSYSRYEKTGWASCCKFYFMENSHWKARQNVRLLYSQFIRTIYFCPGKQYCTHTQ